MQPLPVRIELEKLQERLGLSEKRLAEKLDVSYSYVNHIKNGYRPVSTKIARSLAELSGLSVNSWLALNEDLPKKTTPDKSGSAVDMLMAKWRKEPRGLLSNKDIIDAVDAEFLVLQPLNFEQLEWASYLLTNEKILSDDGNTMIELNDETDCFEIKPNEKVEITVAEEIIMPANIYAQIDVTNEAVNHLNLHVSPGSRIQPNWPVPEDRPTLIKFQVSNPNSEEVKIYRDTRLIAVCFHFMLNTPMNDEELEALRERQKIQNEIDRLKAKLKG